MASLGESALKTEVPATMTLQPDDQYQKRQLDSPLTTIAIRLTSLGAIANVPWPDTTIDLNMFLDTFEPPPQFPSLFQTLGHELLAACTGVDGHDQDHICRVEGFVRDGAGRSLGGDG
jgi:hypothetical protein